YECAPLNRLVPVGDTPDPDTGMWVVEPSLNVSAELSPWRWSVNLDTVACAAHLLLCTALLPENSHFSNSLDAFDHYL
ncbi:hypothetical protein K438DRAFT_1635231, partial [Mycena galopus ATCC 62051]